MSAMPLLGFTSRLPLALSGGTLQAWLATTSAKVKTIGVFLLLNLPYTPETHLAAGRQAVVS